MHADRTTLRRPAKEVIDIVNTTPPADRKYRLDWSTETTNLVLQFSRYTDRGNVDEACSLRGLLIARKHDGKDHWSEPIRRGL